MKLTFALRLSAVALAGSLAALTTPAMAQHDHGTTAAPAMAPTAAEMADGEIRRIDPAKGTVLLKHGEIKSLNMGAMTMGFRLKDASLASGLKAGDKVRFAAEQKGEELIVTKITKVN